MRVAVVASGEMGSAIAARLKNRGAQVFTSLAGRSAASCARATRADLGIIDDDAALIAAADVFLSVVPPARALSIAERFAPALAKNHGTVLYADCNAVAPATVQGIAKLVAATGSAFVDAGIIGGPPKNDDPGPRIYVSGAAAPRFEALREFGLDVRVLKDGIGAASALKMSYAAITKGITAVGVAAARGAADHGVAASLAAELAASQPQLFAWLTRSVPRMYPKAYRFVGEMEEIARFLGTGPGADMFLAAAGTYEEVAAAWAADAGSAEILRDLAEVYGPERQPERAV